MQLDDFKKSLVREMKGYFASKVVDFVVKQIEAEPYLSLDIEFTAYQYFVINLLIERNTAFFTLREGGVRLNLLKSQLLRAPEVVDGEIIGLDVLRNLDAEIRLRIPDKFLEAKGWAS